MRGCAQAERALGTPVAGTARSVAGSVPVLQVEGSGFIKHLEHGLPVTRKGLKDARIEAVEDEPEKKETVEQSDHSDQNWQNTTCPCPWAKDCKCGQ